MSITTMERIKAYQEQLEKGKIRPDKLPPCPLCSLDSIHFREHAQRSRQFLVVVRSTVETVFTYLVRFICPGCFKKTFTWYPDFAIPHKRFTVPDMTGFCETYVESDDKTYLTAVLIDREQPAYPQVEEKMLSASSIHRWITTFSVFEKIYQKALMLILQKKPISGICRELGHIPVSVRKYRSPKRKDQLTRCRRFFYIEKIFRSLFQASIFTNLATRSGFC